MGKSRHISRRNFLKTTTAVGLGTSLVSAPFSKLAFSAQNTGTLKMYGWGFRQEIVEEGLEIYRKLYDEKVEFVLNPANFHPFIETSFLGNTQIDLTYGEDFYANRWYRPGWIKNLEDFPGIDEAIKKPALPGLLENAKNWEGNVVGTFYYTANYLFGYNQIHMDKAKLDPPKTWEELLEQCKQLQMDGISEHPYIGRWMDQTWAIPQQFTNDCFSEGESIFDENNNPTFKDGGVGFQKVLERYRLMLEKGYVPPDVLSMSDDRVTFATGRHTFFTADNYNHQPVSGDPEFSKIAGKVGFAMYPGLTGETLGQGAMYYMGNNNIDNERTWRLMRFFGGKADDGKFYMPKLWAQKAGLGCPYPEVMNDPDVRAVYEKWVDMEIWNAQSAKSKVRNFAKQLWYPEWESFLIPQIHEYVAGKIKIGDCIKSLYDKAVTLKQAYPSFG